MSTENIIEFSSKYKTSRGNSVTEAPGSSLSLRQVLGCITHTGLIAETTRSLSSPVFSVAHSSTCCRDTVWGQPGPALALPITRDVPPGIAIWNTEGGARSTRSNVARHISEEK